MSETTTLIGQDIIRKESADKVTGDAIYNTDVGEPGMLYAWLVTSLYAHANIKYVDTSEAVKAIGVRAVITGQDCPILCGPVLEELIGYMASPS